MPNAIYVRKSRADLILEEKGEGETLTRHINTLLDIAKKRNYTITKIYKEIVSGETITARPVMQQLLSDVEDGMWDGVLVMEVERLARGDTIDQGIVAQTFKMSNTKIITPIKEYDPNNEFDEEYFEFGLFMSRREYKTINRRLQRGRLASVKEGNFVGSTPPYGYDKVKNIHDKGFHLVPNPNEAPIIKMIFDLYTVGEQQPDGTCRRFGTSLIVRRLNDLHIPTKKSLHWSNATVQDILRNPVYIGKLRWNFNKEEKQVIDGEVRKKRVEQKQENWLLYEGKHEGIISEETYHKAQEFLSKNPARPLKNESTLKNPLAGIVYCGYCGKAMQRRPYYDTKHAETLLCPDTACQCVSTELCTVEKRVLDSLKEWKDAYMLKWHLQENEDSFADEIENKQNTLALLIKKHDTLQKQLSATHDLLEQGVYTVDDFLKRSQLLSKRLQDNEEAMQQLDQEILLRQRRENSRLQILPKITNLLSVYNTLPTAKEKNDLLKEVLEKAVYKKDKGGRWHNSPDDFTIELFPFMED